MIDPRPVCLLRLHIYLLYACVHIRFLWVVLFASMVHDARWAAVVLAMMMLSVLRKLEANTQGGCKNIGCATTRACIR